MQGVKTKHPPAGDWSYFLGTTSGAGVQANMYPAKFTNPAGTPSCTSDYAAFALNKAGSTGSSGQPSMVAFNQLYSGPALAAIAIGNFMAEPATSVTFTIKNGTTTLTITAGSSNSGTTFTRNSTVATNATNFVAAINRSGNGSSVGVSAASNGTTVHITATTAGTSGNSITLSTTAPTGGFLWSGANLSGGTGTGICGSGAPTVTWAYATASSGTTPVMTSPVLSLDGTMIAFVEEGTTAASGAILHLLRPNATDGTNGATIAPVTPSHTVTNWNACTAGASCMINLAYTGTSKNTNSNSSPFYDPNSDSIYIGDDQGVLYKVTPVFLGGATVPAVAWHVTVDAGAMLTGPNFDFTSLNVFIGDSNGTASYVRTSASSSGACGMGSPPCLGSTTLALGNANASPGIADPPLVDGTNGKVYFIGGNTSSSNVVVVQANTTLGGVVQDSIGAGSGNSGHDTQGLHNGDFDNNFYNTGTGNLYVCGNTNNGNTERAELYQIGVTSGALNSTVGTGKLPLNTSTAGECSPMTEIYNPTTGADLLFVSVPASAAADPCLGSACVMAFPILGWQAATIYPVSNQILDSNLNIQQVTTPGTSKTGSAPTWNTSPGATTSDGSVTWTNLGQLFPTATAEATGGTSGMIIDNVSSSSQASSLYYATLGATTCDTSGGGNVTTCAVKRTQLGLQ